MCSGVGFTKPEVPHMVRGDSGAICERTLAHEKIIADRATRRGGQYPTADTDLVDTGSFKREMHLKSDHTSHVGVCVIRGERVVSNIAKSVFRWKFIVIVPDAPMRHF